MKRYIFITGGVVSSLGKGIAAASIGAILEKCNLKVSLMKLDPYINIDPGTMNPIQHGEVFVTADGGETDLDLGHYERFVNFKATKKNNFTTGQVYQTIINKEREGVYLGETIQVIPHITNEIKRRIIECDDTVDIQIVEIGGTVGDIESLPFLEAIRQIGIELGKKNVCYIHLTLIPYLEISKEYKTKPTQHSVKELLSIGIQPDIILCRCKEEIEHHHLSKISLFTNVSSDSVITIPDVKDIHKIPEILYLKMIDKIILEHFNLPYVKPDLSEWINITNKKCSIQNKVVIGFVGKYINLIDSYKSLNEAIIDAGIHLQTKVEIKYIDSENINLSDFADIDGILIPGGFGTRGIEGKIYAAKHARENNVPFFGICLGMQIACIEFARNVLKLNGAHSTEFDIHTIYPIFNLLSVLSPNHNLGGTMRLGEYECKLKKHSLISNIYGTDVIYERHRHRYEFNNKYIKLFQDNGMMISGIHCDVYEDTSKEVYSLVESVELEDHPWFLGCQFHPEFTSNPKTGHKLFISFTSAVLSNKIKNSKYINNQEIYHGTE